MEQKSCDLLGYLSTTFASSCYLQSVNAEQLITDGSIIVKIKANSFDHF